MAPRTLALFLALLLLLSAIPDTMAAPVLKELFVDRYAVSPRDAQIFMAFNLVGALAAIPLLAWARRRVDAVTLVVLGSLADAALLGILAAPVGFGVSLGLRAVEGVTDVVVFAALFDIVRRVSGGHAARGLGMASTPLLLGLGMGALASGGIAKWIGGGPERTALAVFGASMVFCVALAVLAWQSRRALRTAMGALPPQLPPPNPAADVAAGTFDDRARPPWWCCAMAFSDRATGGLITGTLSNLMAGVLGYTPAQRGWLIGLPLLLMAVCTGPAGALCDRVGSLRSRLVASVIYAVAFGLIPLAGASPTALGIALTAVGLAGAVLFSSSLAIAAESGQGAVALGAFRSSGDMGFFLGTTLAIVMVPDIGATAADYSLVILVLAGMHLGVTGVIAVLAWKRRREGGLAGGVVVFPVRGGER